MHRTLGAVAAGAHVTSDLRQPRDEARIRGGVSSGLEWVWTGHAGEEATCAGSFLGYTTNNAVDLMGRYSNPNIVARLERVLSGQGRDRVSHRPVPSLRQQQTRLTDSQRSEVVRRYEAGESASALAREFGVHRTTVFRALRAGGVDVRYGILTHDDVDEARALYQSGVSLAAVGERLGVAAGTVLNAFRKAGVPTRQIGTNQWS